MKRRASVLIIFLTVFIDLIGFGIVVPLVAVYSKIYGAGSLAIGLIVASFSAMQFVFSPIWGRLSDKLGRRPILLLSTAGAALSYVLLAVGSGLENHTTALWVLLLSRVFAGICGGNITVAQAYMADITPPDQRSRGMGLIGMAFGLGFIFGPAIGGISLKHFGYTGPGWIASILCAANFILAFFILGESRQAGSERAPDRPHLEQWRHALTHPKVGLLILLFFLATFAFSCFECTLPLLVNDHFHLALEKEQAQSAASITWLYVFCGLIGAFVQGGAIGRLVKKYGEPRLIGASLILTGISLALLPYIKGGGQLTWSVLFHAGGGPWIKLLLVLAVLSIGTSLTRPPLFGLLSHLTPPNEQGATIGVAQSAGSLARILAPPLATLSYGYIPSFPYLVCGAICLAAAGLALRLVRQG